MIDIPTLRPVLDGKPFPGTEVPSILEALEGAQRWIDSGETHDGREFGGWIAWPERPDFVPAYGTVSLNTGAAGIAWYTHAAGSVLGDASLAERAARAVQFVASHWREHVDDRFIGIEGTGLGYYGGIAGIGAALLALAESDPLARRTAAEIFDLLVARRGADGEHPAWLGIDAMLGDGGIIVSLLSAAEVLGDERYRDAAAAAGEALLASEQRASDTASRWVGTDPQLLGLPPEMQLDGLELGTIGVAFVLARLAVATGDERFRDAAVRAAAAIAEWATVAGDAALTAPGAGGRYAFGYCTGSSGVIRSLIAVYNATGDPEHLEWALRFGRGILRSGVPGRHTPGNGWVLHQCCGSAAILEAFLGLWATTGDELWLDAARVQGDDLLIRSVQDARGRRWYSEAYVLPTGTLKAEVGHQVGASGIALALLRLHVAEQRVAGAALPAVPRLPDDPFPLI